MHRLCIIDDYFRQDKNGLIIFYYILNKIDIKQSQKTFSNLEALKVLLFINRFESVHSTYILVLGYTVEW